MSLNAKKRRANISLTGNSPGDIVLAVSGHNIRHHRNIKTHGVPLRRPYTFPSLNLQ